MSELEEEDVWSMVDGNGEYVGSHAQGTNYGHSVGSRSRISGDDSHVGGLSLAFDDSGKTTPSSRVVQQFRSHAASPRGHQVASSAPVNVPDWHKILRVDSSESMPDSDDFDDHDSEMVPPHEYLARSRRSAATSVFEGVGRTLKGRDMSRVRDAVWNQTGFDG